MPNLFALLVGIDQYPPGIPTLSGCCNDITAFETFLRERASQSGFQLQLEPLKDAQASRQNVIDGFRQHLSRAAEGDVALFYYSGHGSQNHTPPEFWYLEPDHLDETLVCHDSRSPGKYDLADKELAVLIAEAAKSNPHILVILDCCHSGSGTRAPLEADGVKVRRAITDTRVRPVESYLAPRQELDRVVAGRAGNTQVRSRLPLPRGRHILMAACREDEEAKEILGDGQLRGVFSYCLTQSLQLTGGGLTYHDLFKRVNALVRIKTARQSPLIEVTDTGDLDMPLFGGAIQSHTPYFTASFDRDLGWVIDGGAVHGIPPPAAAETTRLAIFPVPSQLDQMEDSTNAIGEAAVTDRMPARSRITLQLKEGAPNEALTYHAAITSLPLAPLQFQLTGEGAAIELLRRALSTAGPGGAASLLVRESPTQGELHVIAGAKGYRIRRTSDDRALVIDVEGATPESARQTIARLEHIARWNSVAELRNPASRLPADAVKLELYYVAASGEETLIEPQESGAELRFGYEFAGGEWRRPMFKMRLLNQSGRRLYCMLLDLPETYGIYSGLLAANGQWLDAGASAWATYQGSMLIPGEVPAELVAQGLTEIKDTLKVIASTEECDATLLEQPDLDVHFEPGRGAKRGLAFSNTLANLMRRVQTRHFGQRPGALADWTTTETTLTISAPGKSVPVPRSGTAVGLNERVQLLPHDGLKAVARLSAAVTSSRDPDLPALPPLPPWLIDDPEVVQPFEFSPSRGGEAGLSVLELNDVDPESVTTVTTESPLQLRVQAPLEDDQQILPVSFDGEFFLPLGWGRTVDGEVEIHIERLPEPSTNRRTLTGSIRIFFKKVIAKHLGTEYVYPLLAVADRIETGGVRYTVDAELVRSRVPAAKRILLYIHGIIGDTRALAASAFSWGLVGRTDSSPFDLVLTFDYENLNTPIEETARDLKLRLTEAGLEPGCAQEVYVVAHSMGGLVARWFIEREGGDKVIRHLVMLGTPNGGSPWPRIVDWATTVIAFGMNGLSKMHWPPTVLGALARITTKIGVATADRLGKIEVALDEMNPGSSFLQELGRTSQIPIRYSVVAGNTSLVEAILEEENANSSRIQRLLRRLNPRQVASEQATLMAFFGLPNDIAVSVEAIRKLPSTSQQATQVHEAACDHLTYFISDAGMKAVLDILH